MVLWKVRIDQYCGFLSVQAAAAAAAADNDDDDDDDDHTGFLQEILLKQTTKGCTFDSRSKYFSQLVSLRWPISSPIRRCSRSIITCKGFRRTVYSSLEIKIRGKTIDYNEDM